VRRWSESAISSDSSTSSSPPPRNSSSYDCLKKELLALKRLVFGPRRERLPEAPGQQHLFDTDVPPPVPDLPTDPELDPESPARRPRKGAWPQSDPRPLAAAGRPP
jgi:Transposase C of IS166 homeodomain